MFRFSFAILLAVSVVNAAPAPSTPAPKGPTPEQIQQAIDDLASPRFAVRERASKLLWEAGGVAESALRTAAKSKDEETASRAKTILEKFDWGIYPDTPAEVTKLIDKFRGGEQAVRLEAVGEMMLLRPTRFATLRKVISHEEDESARQQMHLSMSSMARRTVPGLIVSNQLGEATELLEICISPANQASLGDYAAFQYLSQGVPDAIKRMESLRTKGSALDSQRAAEALVYLHRIRRIAGRPQDGGAVEESPSHRHRLGIGRLEDIGSGAPERRPARLPRRRDGRVSSHGWQQGGVREAHRRTQKELAGVEGNDGSAYILAYALLNGRGSMRWQFSRSIPSTAPI